MIGKKFNSDNLCIFELKKNRCAEIGNQVPLRTEWCITLQVQVLLPINCINYVILVYIFTFYT